jgi:hypothetical protein
MAKGITTALATARAADRIIENIDNLENIGNLYRVRARSDSLTFISGMPPVASGSLA